MTAQVPILVLAAGQSRRMQGQDKLLLTVDKEPLLRRTARMAHATGQPVLVALPPPLHPRYDVVKGLQVTCLPVANPTEGMNASLRCALAAVPDGAQAVMVLLADLPEIDTDHLNRVLAACAAHPGARIWRGTDAAGRPGHPVVFHRDLWPELRKLQGDGGARSVVAAHRDAICDIALPGRAATLDLDTPQAWADWRAGR